MEAFYSLQGEGFHTGKAAYFIRLAGCDVGCHWCDVKESWDVNAHPTKSVSSIVENALKYPTQIAIITGGEPLMHDLTELCGLLKQSGYQTHLETSGTHPISGDWNWICFSPKKFKAPLGGFSKLAHELKVIVYNRSDLEFAKEHASQVGSDCYLYLQPEWDRSKEVTPMIMEFIKDNPKWKISLQTHKYLNIP